MCYTTGTKYFQALSKKKLKRTISSVASDMSSIRDGYENDEESNVDKKWKKLLSGETILNVSTTGCNDVSVFPG